MNDLEQNFNRGKPLGEAVNPLIKRIDPSIEPADECTEKTEHGNDRQDPVADLGASVHVLLAGGGLDWKMPAEGTSSGCPAAIPQYRPRSTVYATAAGAFPFHDPFYGIRPVNRPEAVSMQIAGSPS